MKHTAKKRLINRIRKKLSGTRGFSLGELLAATLILLLASQVLTQGMAFSARMYNESLTKSHARQLCSTLTNVIETELRYTTEITVTDNRMTKYFSPSYGKTESRSTAGDILQTTLPEVRLPYRLRIRMIISYGRSCFPLPAIVLIT